MDDWKRERLQRELNEGAQIHRDLMAQHLPIKFSVKQIRAMTDDQILALLSGEEKPTGTLYHDTLHLLSYELNRRELQRATATHWTTVPGFWFTVVAALFGVIGVLVAVVIALVQAKQSDAPAATDSPRIQQPAQQ